MRFSTPSNRIWVGKASATPKPNGHKVRINIAYWATAIRRSARFWRRRAWASRDSSSRCSSRCSGWAANQRSGSRASRAAVSPGAMAAIRRSTSVKYGHTSTQFRRALCTSVYRRVTMMRVIGRWRFMAATDCCLRRRRGEVDGVEGAMSGPADSWRRSGRVASVPATEEACRLGRMERRPLACRIARVRAAVWRWCPPLVATPISTFSTPFSLTTRGLASMIREDCGLGCRGPRTLAVIRTDAVVL